jgi:hypothetical protein
VLKSGSYQDWDVARVDSVARTVWYLQPPTGSCIGRASGPITFLVIQGSVTQADIKNDFDFLPTYGALTRGRVVHRGFINALLEWANARAIGAKTDWDIDDDVSTFVTGVIAEIDANVVTPFASSPRLIIGGYSLGGAIAQLLGYMFDLTYYSKLSVTTYGCPNVFYHLQQQVVPRVFREWRNYVVTVVVRGISFHDPIPLIKPTCYKLGRHLTLSPIGLRIRLNKETNKEQAGTIAGSRYAYLASQHYHYRVLLHRLDNYIDDKTFDKLVFDD